MNHEATYIRDMVIELFAAAAPGEVAFSIRPEEDATALLVNGEARTFPVRSQVLATTLWNMAATDKSVLPLEDRTAATILQPGGVHHEVRFDRDDGGVRSVTVSLAPR